MKGLVFVVLVAAVYAKHEHYAGWKSYYVKPDTQDQLMTLGSKVIEYELDFLSHARVGREGVVLVKPAYQADFQKFLSEAEINYWIHANDVKAQLDIDDILIEARKQETRSFNGGRIPYDNYQPLDVIYDYIDRIAEEYPETVTLVTPGNSFEGRPLKYLKISTDNFESNKPIIYIDGALHAREWITPPVVTYAIYKLVENVTEPDLLERFDWIIFPVVNPDGYVFSFENQRMWRKTRSTDQTDLSEMCPGVDGNRNFDFFWNTVGTSNNPCSDTYAGSRAFSEVETRAVDDIIQEYYGRILLFLTMHSYGSMILYPWNHDGTLSIQAFALQTVGVAMAEAIDAVSIPYFPRYSVGNSALTIGYLVSGAAEDYAHYEGVPISFTQELPGLDSGLQGFHLNPRYIPQVVVETWAGIIAGARRTSQLFPDRM